MMFFITLLKGLNDCCVLVGMFPYRLQHSRRMVAHGFAHSKLIYSGPVPLHAIKNLNLNFVVHEATAHTMPTAAIPRASKAVVDNPATDVSTESTESLTEPVSGGVTVESGVTRAKSPESDPTNWERGVFGSTPSHDETFATYAAWLPVAQVCKRSARVSPRDASSASCAFVAAIPSAKVSNCASDPFPCPDCEAPGWPA